MAFRFGLLPSALGLGSVWGCGGGGVACTQSPWSGCGVWAPRVGNRFTLATKGPCLEVASGPGKALALKLRDLGPTSDWVPRVVTLCWSVREEVVFEPE